MITVNGIKITPEHFLAGEQRLFGMPMFNDEGVIVFELHYTNDEEIMTLFYLSNHYRDLYPEYPQYLKMMYIPNARMDRVKDKTQVFTMKHFAKFINNLDFRKVITLDAHSDVSVALLDRIDNMAPMGEIRWAVEDIAEKNKLRFSDIVLYFPDAGAHKRYGGSAFCSNFAQIYGEKIRDFSTGDIKGLEVKTCGVNLIGKNILMIDDIISYGGTMYHSANELNKLGVNKIYAYASHTENAVLDTEKGTFIKSLNDGTVTSLYTTNSIFTGKHSSIIVNSL